MVGAMADGVSKRGHRASVAESNLWPLHVLSFEEFLADFSPHDMVANDVKVARRIRTLIKDELSEVDNAVT